MERQTGKPEIAGQKRNIKLTPALGDWTTYKPPKVLVKRVKTGLYGFDRLSTEDLKLALMIHYRFMEKMLQRFKVDLNMSVELFSVSVEQTTYLNFMRTMSGSVAQTKVTLPGIHDTVNFVFDLLLANSIINYSLGSHDLELINRALTDAENEVLSTTLTGYLPEYTNTFRNVFAPPSAGKINSPDTVIDQSINTSATYVAFSAEISLADNPPGRIVIGYLGNTIKNLLAKYKQKEPRLNFARLHPGILSKITVPVIIDLGQTSLTTNEIHQLEDGDVISLDSSIKSAIPLKIGKIMKLLCQPGIKDNKISIRIAGIKDEDRIEVTPPPLEEEPTLKLAPTTEPPAKDQLIEEEPIDTDEKTYENTEEENMETEDDFLEDDFEDDFLGDDDDDDDLDSEEEKEDSTEESAETEEETTDDDFLDDDFSEENEITEKEE